MDDNETPFEKIVNKVKPYMKKASQSIQDTASELVPKAKRRI